MFLLKNKKFTTSLFLPLFLLVLVEIIAPVYIYWLYKPEIIWTGAQWFRSFFHSFIIIFPILIIASFFNVLTNKYFKVAVIVAFMYIFIRVFFYPISFEVLDGAQIQQTELFSDISLYISMFIILFLIVVTIKKLPLMTVLVYLLFWIGLFISFYINFTAKPKLVGQANAFTAFSKNNNILVMGFDSVQNNVLIDIISHDDSIKKQLQDFTLYTDVLSYAPNTSFSLLSTLTSRYLNVGEKGASINKLSNNNKNLSLVKLLSNNNYDVSTFNVNCQLSIKNRCFKASDVLPKDISTLYTFTARDIFLLKTLPKSFSFSLLQHSNVSKKFQLDQIPEIIADKSNHGFSIEKYVFQKLYQEMTLIDKDVFKFYHFRHTHQPIKFNDQGQYIKNRVQNMGNAKLEIKLMLNEFENFKNELKKKGIYDDSLIILSSDHGYMTHLQKTYLSNNNYNGSNTNKNGLWPAGRYWPILLVKLPHQTGELVLDNKPAELIDIYPTILQTYNIKPQHKLQGGVLGHSKKISRKAMVFVGGKNKNYHIDSRLFRQITIDGNAYKDMPKALKNNPKINQ